MHNSRLSTFVIDCKSKDPKKAAAFWSKALRREVKPSNEPKYRDLRCSFSEPLVMIQAVAHESRIHLDIESDDIPAEVARLEKLGAKRIEAIKTWVVMEAPTGQRFCVVRPQRGALELQVALHAPFEKMLGHFTGETKVWLDPKKKPDVAEGELHVSAVCGGKWLRMEERGSCMGKPRASEITLGMHKDLKRYEMSYIDTFHTGSSIMYSVGEAKTKGPIAVTGTYPAGDQVWGWRTEFHIKKNGFTARAINLSPEGEEFRAVETNWTR